MVIVRHVPTSDGAWQDNLFDPMTDFHRYQPLNILFKTLIEYV